MLRTGTLREHVTIQVKTLTTDQYHEQSEAWADVATVPAAVGPIPATEQVTADRLETQQRLLITIRYRTDVTVKNRLKHVYCGETRYYDVVSVTDRGMRRRALDITAVYEQDNQV